MDDKAYETQQHTEGIEDDPDQLGVLHLDALQQTGGKPQ